MDNQSLPSPQQVRPQVNGVIISVNMAIAEVEMDSEASPNLYEILTSPDDPSVVIEVYAQSKDKTSCSILSDPKKLYRGMRIIGDRKSVV